MLPGVRDRRRTFSKTLNNERPYLDHPEQLRYSTEAWAAQEFHMANVSRLAFQHVDANTAQFTYGRDLNCLAFIPLGENRLNIAYKQFYEVLLGARHEC